MDTEIELYPDETLESFVLRLSNYQGYERFAHFAEDIWRDTLLQHEAIPGGFSFELSRVNLYKAQTTSQMRVRVLLNLEKQRKLNDFGILRLALAHSKAVFSSDYKAVHRFGVDYPQVFIRKRHTPVCPQCLAAAAYIRQEWQFIPYLACHKHHCKLVHRCPKCGKLLDYQSSESIDHCECGFPLSQMHPEKAEIVELQAAQWLMGEKPVESGLMTKDMGISSRFGFILWYVNRYGDADDISFEDFIQCCTGWPKRLVSDLDGIVEKADMLRVRPWNKMYFNEVFGDLLRECRHLPSRELAKNQVLSAVLNYLTKLVAKHPKSKKPNIGDVLLSSLEASTLLSCTTDEIYRLYEYGEIKAQLTPKLHCKLSPHESVFTLRSVVEVKLARMSSESDGLYHYLPEW
ncbi:TPA: hypothetical protein I7764_08830 [Vibrio vulnificus]|nr:hypothetical protein [Vibrio vulnificus]